MSDPFIKSYLIEFYKILGRLKQSSIHSKGLGEIDVLANVVGGHTGLATFEGSDEILIFGLQEYSVVTVFQLLHIALEVFFGWVLLCCLAGCILDHSIINYLFPESDFIETSDWCHQGIID